MKVYLCDESDCCELAVYVRRTQFAGDHYFCNSHARQEGDFFCADDHCTCWEEILYEGSSDELQLALQEARMECFLYENRETIVFLGVILSRMLLADLCLSSVAPSPIFAVVGRLAKERGIDLESLFTKMESLQVPPLTDGYNGSVLRS